MSDTKPVIILIMLIVIAAIVGFVFLGDKIPFIKDRHERIFSDIKPLEKSAVSNKVNSDWCFQQEIKPSDDIEKPIKDRITGWDSIEECCIKQIEGYNCALHENSILEYCFTAHIGGEVKYAKIDNFYVKSEDYKKYIEDYDKEYIMNKQCDTTKYPEELLR